MQSSEVEPVADPKVDRANEEKADAAGDETARAAGRGGLVIAIAKVAFIVFGFAQQVLLPQKWLLGVDGYGAVRTVLSAVNVVNNVIVALAIQGVSRAVSQAAKDDVDGAFRRVLRVHVGVALALSIGFALVAGIVAEELSAPHITQALRVGACVVLMYGVYAPLVGSLNGRRRFLDQAGLDIGYGAIRLFAMICGVSVFLAMRADGVLGAMAGFAVGAAVIVPIALTRSGLGKAGGLAPPMRDYLLFLLPLAVGLTFLNFLMQTDAFFVSRFVGKAAGTTDEGVKLANTLRGVYGGAQLFAFLPYQLLMSITFILFPLLAKASAEGDRAAVRSYTRTGVRLALLLTGLMCGAISATAPHVLRMAFPVEIWSQGGPVLRILALGMGAFTILGIANTALTALGKVIHAMLLTLLGVLLIAGGCSVLVPAAELGPPMLVAAATATSVALTVTAIVAGAVLSRVAGGFVSPVSLARVLLALGVAIAAGSRLPWIRFPGVVLEVTAVGALYVVVLIVTGELGKADLAQLVKVARRRK